MHMVLTFYIPRLFNPLEPIVAREQHFFKSL